MNQDKAIAKLVHDLPDDVPSLAWRSQLNERILAESHCLSRRKRILSWSAPSAGLALAAAVTLVMLSRSAVEMQAQDSARSFESALVTTHREAQFAITETSFSVGEADVFGEFLPSRTVNEADVEGI